MTTKELIKALNKAFINAHVSNGTIHEVDDADHFARLVQRYGMETLYKNLNDSIAIGDFNWDDEYFFCDVKSHGEFFSFTTKEQLFDKVGKYNVMSIIENDN